MPTFQSAVAFFVVNGGYYTIKFAILSSGGGAGFFRMFSKVFVPCLHI